MSDAVMNSGPQAPWDPDVRLMLAVRDGDAAAFEEIVRKYQGRLLTVLRHLVDSSDSPEDLAQEVFLRVFRAREDYVPTARFATWIFTIAHHVASNARRTLARRREVQVLGGEDSQSFGGIETLAKDASSQMPTRIVDRGETEHVIRAAIQSLNERQRLALLLSKFEGMNYADIGKTMELSEDAVKSLLARARRALKESLGPYLQDGQYALSTTHSVPELPTP